jgi:hypothetical protein
MTEAIGLHSLKSFEEQKRLHQAVAGRIAVKDGDKVSARRC